MEDNIAKVGELARPGHDFCPYAAVAKFPYKYIDKAHLQPVSETFFAGGQFRARGWTLYYIHPHLDISSKPIVLVPALEVEALLYDINEGFGTSYQMPSHNREPGFLLNFDDKGSPRPRYLGRVDIDISVEDMEVKIPAPGDKASGEPEMHDDRSFAAFKAKMEAAIQATKNKTKSQREKKKRERISLKQSWCAQLQRAQCYLGVRPRRGLVPRKDPLTNGSLTWAEYQEAQKAYDIACSANLPALDVTKSVPYLFDKNVVFVCVDVEAWEKDHSVVTEIGVSTLDTNDLVNLPPGEGGKNWMTAIRPRHFRILEHKHLINTEFIAGCADRFEKDFGTSSFISINEAPQVMASCFREPFSANYQMKSHSGVPGPTLHTPNLADSQTKRNVILVGHDIRSDIDYLRRIGYDVSNLPNLLEAIDTADLFKALKHEQQSRSLGGVLLELEMVGWNLHNAGNDAAYTLQAMIGVAFASLQDKQKREKSAEAERARRMGTAAQDAQDRIIEESQEWEAADVDGDGGVPVAISKPGDDRRNDPRKGGPKPNYAARTALQPADLKKAQAKNEASLSASKSGVVGDTTRQESDLIDLGDRPIKDGTGLFIQNAPSKYEVLNLFYEEDEQNIIEIVSRGKARWSVHFSTHEQAKAALDRQPSDRKKRDNASKPGQPLQPHVKWLDDKRLQSTNSTNYVPVTEWGPQVVTNPPTKPKDLSARMKARLNLLDEGGVKL